MLTDSSLAIITFVNLLFVPFISLRIYCKRRNVEWTFNFDILYKYVLFCVTNMLFARIVCNALGKVTDVILLADSSKYTLVAVVTASILPFLFEIIEHYVKVDVQIDYQNKKEKKEQNEK